MFSPREIDNDQFIYGCHGCGWESDVMTTEEAISVAARISVGRESTSNNRQANGRLVLNQPDATLGEGYCGKYADAGESMSLLRRG